MRALNLALGWLAALLGSSAVGALWALWPLTAAWLGWATRYQLLAMLPQAAPLAALLLVALLAFLGVPAGRWRALAALALYLLALAHANYLTAAGSLAGTFGYRLDEALPRIGVEMAFALARAHTDQAGVWLYLIGAALAVVLSGWRSGAQAPARRGTGRGRAARRFR